MPDPYAPLVFQVEACAATLAITPRVVAQRLTDQLPTDEEWDACAQRILDRLLRGCNQQRHDVTL